MQIIHDSKAIFDVTINPFEKEICVKKGTLGEEHTHTYKDNDEWFTYSFDGRKYDFHFLYDVNKLSFRIYEVVNDEVDYTAPVSHNLHIEIGV